MKKLISVLLIIALLFLFIPQQVVSGASADAYLIATNPGEDTSKEMNVIWHTTITGTFVEYTTKDDTGFASATQVNGQCQAITYYDQGLNADLTDYKCEATLTNLTSDTEYIYHIGKTNFSAVYGFMTSGDSAFTFIYLSDVHVYTPIPDRVNAAQKLITAIESKYRNLKLVVTGGDMTAYGTLRDQWTSYYGLTMFPKYIVASTNGNHEYYNKGAEIFADSEKYFNMYINNPKNGAVGVKNTSYYFTYGNVLFISIDSEAYRLSSQPAAYAENQRVWLEEVLANNHSQYTVLFHHAPHYGGAAVTRSMWDLQPMIDKYGVDLVLNGHDHVYTRSNRIYNGVNGTDSKKGAIYVTSSAIGDRFIDEKALSTDIYVAKKIANKSLAMGITVSADYLMLKVYDETGNIVDQVNIPAKMADFDVADSMKNVKIEVAENFAQSKLLYPNEFFAKAYKVDLLEGEEIITSFRPLDNQTSVIIPNLNAGVYQKNYKVNVYFRDDQMATKDLTITNPHAVFGTIDNVRVSGKNLIWNSQIDNAMLQKIVVSANGTILGEVSPTTKEISLASLNDKQVNNIVFSALDAEGNVLFTTSLTYGEEYIPYSVSFTDDNAQLEVGEDKTLQVSVLPNLDVTLVFTSSDSSIVRIDEGKIIAVKAGEAIITVTVTGHPEATDALTVKVVKVEEEVVEPTDPVDPVEPVEPEAPVKETGCKSAMSLWYLLIPLGLVILRKKKY